MEQFYYFVCLDTNKDLLKKELELFAPKLRPSFSQGAFMTYKGELATTSTFCFALDWGSSTGVDKASIEQKLLVQKSSIVLPEKAPSRAYLKIAEACEKFKIQDPKLNWIEFGCAPGGASMYLLNNFSHIIGIDPAEMDPSIYAHKNFTFIKKPIQKIKDLSNLSFTIDYITSDLNLNPKQAIEEVLRCEKLLKNVKGILMTIKMVKLAHVKHIPEFIQHFKQAGFTQVKTAQLPSHKREFLLFASR